MSMTNIIGIGDIILEKNMIIFEIIQSNLNPSAMNHGFGPDRNPDNELLRGQSNLNAFLIHEEAGLEYEFAPSGIHENWPCILYEGWLVLGRHTYLYLLKFLPLSMGEVPLAPDHPPLVAQNPSEPARKNLSLHPPR